MKHTLLLSMVLSTSVSFAQQDTVAAGGNSTSPDGTVSFSVGQVAYSSTSDTSGNSNQGVQQPIEIYTLNNSDFAGQIFNATLFPNPTASSVTLSITDNRYSNLEYQITDITGKIVRTGRISTIETSIDVRDFPEACYFVNVMISNKRLKTFKLLKNH